MRYIPSRQVHLDFHTSEHINGIGADFDPVAFATTCREAHINSVTVFGACHHGWLYYPSKGYPHYVHPHLKVPDLLVQQVRALHEAGIRAPVYVTVQWARHQADTCPEWLIRKADGAHEGDPFHQPGFYQSLCVNTSYRQYVKDIVSEIGELLGSELDGFFFDIVGIRPCLCAACRRLMADRGIDLNDPDKVRAFAVETINGFKVDLSAHVRAINPKATIFYNAGHVGPCTKASTGAYSHFEIESLPSGGWGYLHFPVAAKYARKLGLDVMGMTGKFHTSWGDFHSLKNSAALEFECFRMLSYGMAISVGDQLEPRGTLNPATYRLIGDVYRRIEACEPWARPATPVVEAALVTPETPLAEHMIPDSILGAVQMLDELALQFDIIDPDMAFDGYRLLILPDDLTVDEAFQRRIDAYVAQGGAVIACAKGGFNAATGAYPASFGARHLGPRHKYPDFIEPKGLLAKDLEADAKYVIYLQGEAIEPAGGEAILSAIAPYFPREGFTFCSHRYTPAAPGDAYPAAVRNGSVILFGHPLFLQYRDNAPRWCKTLIRNAVLALLERPLVSHDGPDTLVVTVLDQPEHKRYAVHLLHYIPVRKSATIDIIEEATPLHNLTLTLNLPRGVQAARVVPEGEVLPIDESGVVLQHMPGYTVLELSYA